MPPLHTRTLNPLPFEALEPKRFEDLVRQLLYDFRPWRQLEATGRAGSDDGFDARGWEVVPATELVDESEGDEGEVPSTSTDRLWLVQCKREKAIGPTKLLGYLNEIDPGERQTLHGIVLAASADFSKKARDEFRKWCAWNGLRECYLWGRAELEDALFQPKNDHLLFAYFGFSLSIRQRSRQTTLRARTTIKRKLRRALDGHNTVLIRDARDEDYPWPADGAGDKFGWWVYQQPKLTFRGLEVLTRRQFAYIGENGTDWDYANAVDDMGPGRHQDPWRGREVTHPNRQALVEFWDALPEGQRAMLTVTGVIALESILEIDEIGDDYVSPPYPHIFVNVIGDDPFVALWADVRPDYRWGANNRIHEPTPETRVVMFPVEFRKPMPGQQGGPGDSDSTAGTG
jgi:hypothetical protein